MLQFWAEYILHDPKCWLHSHQKHRSQAVHKLRERVIDFKNSFKIATSALISVVHLVPWMIYEHDEVTSLFKHEFWCKLRNKNWIINKFVSSFLSKCSCSTLEFSLFVMVQRKALQTYLMFRINWTENWTSKWSGMFSQPFSYMSAVFSLWNCIKIAFKFIQKDGWITWNCILFYSLLMQFHLSLSLYSPFCVFFFIKTGCNLTKDFIVLCGLPSFCKNWKLETKAFVCSLNCFQTLQNDFICDIVKAISSVRIYGFRFIFQQILMSSLTELSWVVKSTDFDERHHLRRLEIKTN